MQVIQSTKLTSYLKKGAYQTTLCAASIVIVRLTSFILLPFFTRHITLYEFGLWDYYQIIFSCGLMIFSTLPTSALTRFFIAHKHDPSKQLLNLGTTFFIGLSSLAIISLMALAISLFWARSGSEFLYITLASVALFTPFNILLSYLRAQERPATAMLFFAAQGLTAVALTVWGVHKGYGIRAYFFATLSSAALFFPLFTVLAWRHTIFCKKTLMAQLSYSSPLAINSCIYAAFFIVDRLILKKYSGFDILGEYALLWRFGALFQFFSLSLCEAAPLIFFNTEHERDSKDLARTLFFILLGIVTLGCIAAIIGSHFLLNVNFLSQAHSLKKSLLLFFLPCYLIEIARLMHIYLALCNNTKLLPLFSCAALILQIILLVATKKMQLLGVFIANSCAFSLYLLSLIWLIFTHEKISQRSLDTRRP